MAAIENGNNSTGLANVDAQFNLRANTPGYGLTGAKVGGGPENGPAIFSENDAGTLTGSRWVLSPKTSLERRLRVGMDSFLFDDTFNATTQNTSLWNYIFATLTASQPGAGTLNFGTTQGTAATHGAIMKTFQYFALMGSSPMAMNISLGQFNAALIANEEWRAGFANPTVAGTAPTDGVWFKITTAGVFLEEVYNGSTTTSAALTTLATLTVGTQFEFQLVVNERTVNLWLNDVLLGTISRAAADGQPFLQGSLPIFLQKLCTGSVTNTNTMRVGDISAIQLDVNSNKSWENQLSTMGRNGNLGQNGNTQGKTSLWTNSTAPTAVALTNTTAAFTGLGGIVAVLPTLAAQSDGKLLTFQNPSPTINITGRNLVIRGVSISSAVSVIFAGGPVTMAYAAAYGHTATSLATVETGSFVTATTHAPRIKGIGMDNFIVTAPAGTLGQNIIKTFAAPIVVRPGEFFDIIARNVGTVTTTGAITYVIDVDAYWE